MKDWRTATAAGLCAFDQAHHWRQGDRVYALTLGGCQRVKLYCPACAIARHGAPPDPGEPVTEPVQLQSREESWSRVGTLAEGFDARMAQAGER